MRSFWHAQFVAFIGQRDSAIAVRSMFAVILQRVHIFATVDEEAWRPAPREKATYSKTEDEAHGGDGLSEDVFYVR